MHSELKITLVQLSEKQTTRQKYQEKTLPRDRRPVTGTQTQCLELDLVSLLH